MKESDVTEFKVAFDCMDTLFNQFVVVFRLDETVSNTFFADQNEVLTLFKQADKALTVEEVFQAVLLTDSANRETFFNHVFILTRDDDTVFSEEFVVQ